MIDTKDDKVALGFSTTQSDAPIVKVTSANTKDFIEMRLVSIDIKTIDNWRLQEFINFKEFRNGNIIIYISTRRTSLK